MTLLDTYIEELKQDVEQRSGWGSQALLDAIDRCYIRVLKDELRRRTDAADHPEYCGCSHCWSEKANHGGVE